MRSNDFEVVERKNTARNRYAGVQMRQKIIFFDREGGRITSFFKNTSLTLFQTNWCRVAAWGGSSEAGEPVKIVPTLAQ